MLKKSIKSRPWIFFDFDGTLVDSMEPLRQAYKAFAIQYSIPHSTKEFDSLIGPSIREISKIMKLKHNLKKSLRELTAAYMSHVKRIYTKDLRPFDGAENILIRLKKDGFSLGLVTSASADLALPWIEKQSWNKHFNFMLFSDDVKRSKPHPEIYKKALAKGRCHNASQVIVVEDSLQGIQSARLAGARVIGLAQGHSRTKLLAAGADRVSNELKDLCPLIKDLSLGMSEEIAYFGSKINVCHSGAKFEPRKRNQLFIVKDMTIAKGTLNIIGNFDLYANYLAAIKYKKSFGPALAVSAIVVTSDHHYLIGKRSALVSVYPNYWEFAPAGGLDNSCIKAGKVIDYKAKLVEELTEETGLKRAAIKTINPLLLVWDAFIRTFDIVCVMKLKPNVQNKALKFNLDEYQELKYVTQDELIELIESKQKVIPMTAVILDAYRKGKK